MLPDCARRRTTRPVRPPLLLALLVLVLLAGGCAGRAASDRCGGELAGFTHREATLGDVRLHYVVGGSGPPVVLLHGFPYTWRYWQDVAPRLAARHTVVVPDLRGVGCSAMTEGGYDATTLAEDVRAELASTGATGPVAVVGHDLGGWVAFAWARAHPAEVGHLVLSGSLVPGFGLERLLDFTRPPGGLAHLVAFQRPELSEELIAGRERAFLTGFVGSPRAIGTAAFEAAVQAYSGPGRMRAAMGQYRGLYRDAEDNRRLLGGPLPMPTLALDGQDSGLRSAVSLRQVATRVDEVLVPGAGHPSALERPQAVAEEIERFLGG